MICPLTDKICNDQECRENGCFEQAEDEGEDVEKKDLLGR